MSLNCWLINEMFWWKNIMNVYIYLFSVLKKYRWFWQALVIKILLKCCKNVKLWIRITQILQKSRYEKIQTEVKSFKKLLILDFRENHKFSKPSGYMLKPLSKKWFYMWSWRKENWVLLTVHHLVLHIVWGKNILFETNTIRGG